MTVAPETLAIAERGITLMRRAAGARSLQVFVQSYLPEAFHLPFAPMHLDLFRALQYATSARSARLAIAAPRDHAKSTVVTFGYLLWSICYGREPYTLIISSAAEQAKEKLASIRAALESNECLRRDFPDVCGTDGQPQPKPWREDRIYTHNGVTVRALGTETQVRGGLFRGNRPSLIVCDDLEDEAEVRYEESRAKKREWFERAVMKAGDPKANILVAGTILHHDSLLSRLVDPRKSPSWKGLMYKAILSESAHSELWTQWERIYNEAEGAAHEGSAGPEAAQAFYEANKDAMLEGAEVLWPHRYDYLALQLKKLEGRASFLAEMQNEPISPELAIYQEDDFIYWTDDHATVEELLNWLGPRAQFFGACDPSLGKRGKKGDDTAIIVIVRDSKTRRLYVIEADIRRRQPHNIIAAILQFASVYPFRAFGFECVQFQEVLASDLRSKARRAGLHFTVIKLRPTTDKISRFERLQPLMRSGQIQFCRSHNPLLDQMFQCPMAQHDDGPDALEMAVTVAVKRRPKPTLRPFD